MEPNTDPYATFYRRLGVLRDDFHRIGKFDDANAKLDDDEVSAIRGQYLGFIFQSYNLIPQYTVLENALIPTLAFGVWIHTSGASFPRGFFRRYRTGFV